MYTKNCYCNTLPHFTPSRALFDLWPMNFIKAKASQVSYLSKYDVKTRNCLHLNNKLETTGSITSELTALRYDYQNIVSFLISVSISLFLKKNFLVEIFIPTVYCNSPASLAYWFLVVLPTPHCRLLASPDLRVNISLISYFFKLL